MITITRRLAGQMRVVFRKALNLTRGSGPALQLTTGPDGICVRARLGDVAVEYHGPGGLPQDDMWTPFELLGDVDALRDDPVQLEALGNGRVATDTRFLLDNIPRLPSDDEYNRPVTLDLNGCVAIRAKAAGQSQPTELVLSDSTAGGEPIRINTNRQYLGRAARLGFDKIHLYSPKVPVLCQDEHRRYVWAVLNHEQIIAPADDVIRITSADAGRDSSTTNHKPRRNKVTMPQSTSNGNGRAKTNGHARTTTTDKADEQGIDVLIEQAETVKVSLRESLSKTGELISALKKHRKQSKAVQTALVSLRRLQAVDA